MDNLHGKQTVTGKTKKKKRKRTGEKKEKIHIIIYIKDACIELLRFDCIKTSSLTFLRNKEIFFCETTILGNTLTIVQPPQCMTTGV